MYFGLTLVYLVPLVVDLNYFFDYSIVDKSSKNSNFDSNFDDEKERENNEEDWKKSKIETAAAVEKE